MSFKKFLAILLAAVLVFAFAACGEKPEAPEETEAVTDAIEEATDALIEESTDAEAVEADTTEEASQPDETAAAVEETEAAAEEETEAPAEETTEEAKKVPQTKEEIVEFYKAAAAETDKGPVTTDFRMELVNLTGDGGFGKIASAFEGIVRNALAKKSTPGDSITGGYTKLTADDVASATATDDGKYTTVVIKLKEQTDGFEGSPKEGHVGHGITVLGSAQTAIDALEGVTVDASGGSVLLKYTDPTINVKIDNETGKIVSGTWTYTVNIDVKNVTIKLGPIPIKVEGLRGAIKTTNKL